MKVYHGGTDIITLPLVNIGRDELDFGKGFYVTDIQTQAESWASKIADRRGATPILNIYELDIESAKTKFRCLITIIKNGQILQLTIVAEKRFGRVMI